MTSSKKRSHIDRLLAIGAPFIAWGPSLGEYCSVCGDDRRGGRLAAERLLSLGRKNIAFIGGTRGEIEVRLRYEGYAEAIADAGLDPRARVVYADYNECSAAREVERLLEKEPNLDAIFANSDYMALAAIQRLKESGRTVPDDVAVIGYDDLSIASYVSPALTTVSQRISQAGRILARDLIAYLELGIVTNTVMPVELVIRDSA